MNIPIPTLAFQGLFERSAGQLACRTAIAAAAVGPDEFAGMVLGYLGNAESVFEPFHVAFGKNQTKRLILGDQDALAGRPHYFEHWPRDVRQIVAAARTHLRQVCVEISDGVWIARAPMQLVQTPVRNCDVLLNTFLRLDERVWMSISAHVGAPAGMEI